MHEASLHEFNSFITLTYDDDHLPNDGSVNVGHFQDFAKRLRHHCGKVRLFYCGEYGERLARPHYHACVFGFDFFDRELHSERDGVKLFRSGILEGLWPDGFCTVGDLTFESAAYVARYCVKKQTGVGAEDHYWRLNAAYELVPVAPEFAHMSRRPGIGRGWYDQFKSDVYPSDEVIVRGHPSKPPRYYDSLLHAEDEAAHNAVKDRRLKKARKHADNCTPERLSIRERCAVARSKLLKRGLEGGE